MPRRGDDNGWDGDDDWEFTSAPRTPPSELYALYDGAVARSRARHRAALADGGLDQEVGRHSEVTGSPPTSGDSCFDLLEEYGRHTGHADLLREAVDGRAGEDPPADWRPVTVASRSDALR